MKGNFNYLKSYTYFVPTVPELIILFVWFAVGALAGNGVSLAMVTLAGSDFAMEYGTLICYPLMFIPPMIYASVKSHGRAARAEGIEVDRNFFAPVGGALLAVTVSLATLAASYSCDAINSLLPPMPEFLEKALKSLTTGNVWLNLLMAGVMAPVFEEWLCRGMVMRGLLGNGTRPLWAILISSVVFALIHLNPWQAIPAFILGCLFGYVYYKTGSLRLTMLMHCVNNSFAVLITRVDSIGEADNWMEVFGPQYWYVFAACILLLALVILQLKRIQSPWKK